MNTQHTPGPWFTVERYSGGLSVIDQRGFQHINVKFFAPVFDVCPDKLSFPHWSDSPYLEISDEEQAANARLIAAAPELLEVLQWIRPFIRKSEEGSDMVTQHVDWVQFRKWIDCVDAAIAKATGEKT